MVLLASGYLSPEDQAHVLVLAISYFLKTTISLLAIGLDYTLVAATYRLLPGWW